MDLLAGGGCGVRDSRVRVLVRCLWFGVGINGGLSRLRQGRYMDGAKAEVYALIVWEIEIIFVDYEGV